MSTSDYQLALRMQEELDREYSDAGHRGRREVASPEVSYFSLHCFALLSEASTIFTLRLFNCTVDRSVSRTKFT